jgi:hypothetical protein
VLGNDVDSAQALVSASSSAKLRLSRRTHQQQSVPISTCRRGDKCNSQEPSLEEEVLVAS